jgi:hypothetical protein
MRGTPVFFRSMFWWARHCDETTVCTR